jgi:hypothetical protein
MSEPIERSIQAHMDRLGLTPEQYRAYLSGHIATLEEARRERIRRKNEKLLWSGWALIVAVVLAVVIELAFDVSWSGAGRTIAVGAEALVLLLGVALLALRNPEG